MHWWDSGGLTSASGKVTVFNGNPGGAGNGTPNLNFAGLDGEYGSRDDWTTTPQSIQPGESGKVLVKFNEPGTYPYHCDFHPNQQKGVLILN